MALKTWMEKKIRRFKTCEFAALKTAMLLLGMVFGAYLTTFVKTYVWYFVVVFVVLYAYLLYKIFR